MRPSYKGVLLLCGVLMLNIIFTQFAIHAFYFEHYWSTIVYVALNVLLFPVALLIYHKQKNVGKEARYDEK